MFDVEVLFIGDSHDEDQSVETTQGSGRSGTRMIRGGDTPYGEALEIKLTWSCNVEGEWKKQEKKITKEARTDRATTTLTGLPSKPDFFGDSIDCKVKAEVHITYYMSSADDEDGKLANTEEHFIIDGGGHSDEVIKLAVKPTRGTNQSYADVTVTLLDKQGKDIKAGNSLYDNAV